MKWIYPLLIIFMVLGCYTENKAKNQVDKAIKNFPETVAEITRDSFPCIKTGDTVINSRIDSSGFVYQRNAARDSANKFRDSLDRLKQKLKELPQAVREVCGDYEKIIDQLYNENTRLALRLDNIKPVIEYKDQFIPIEDDAKIRICDKQNELLRLDKEKYKKLYDDDHKWRVIMEAKQEGNWTLYFPKWIAVAAGIALSFYLFFFIRRKVLKK